MHKTARLYFALLLAVLGLAGCRGEDSKDTARQKVLLFAAASTGDALDEITSQFQREHGIDVQTSYAGTSTLARQVVNGAGAEVFVSANRLWADYLEKNGMVARRRDLLGNRLVVVVPAGTPLVVEKPQDLANEKIKYIALAEPRSVPAGMYAKQALVKLGLWERLQPKIVAAADVRRALAYVERGEAEAGIVYATDASASESVKVVLEIPPELTGPIRYPVMLLKQGADKAAAESFYEYLGSPAAAEVFRKHGFVVRTDSAAGGRPGAS